MSTRLECVRPVRDEAELIATVLGGSRPDPRVRAAAARLACMPRWQRRSMGVAELAALSRVGSVGAARLVALWELADRWAPDDRTAITSPRDATLLFESLRSARREQVVALLLDARHRPLRLETVAIGSVNGARLQPRDVFGPALRSDAVAVILGHNHPSGDPAPSRADRVVTAALRSAGDMLGVALLDHVIVAARSHHSFREAEGWERDTAA